MPDIVRVEHLSYIYGQGMPDATVALDDISFSIEEGSFVGVIGSTGCGKSTLIGHFNGINRPTQGKVYIDGEDIWQDPKDIRRFRFLVGLVFQYPEYQLFEETVYKDIAFGPLNMGLSEEEVNRRVLRAAKFCGLGAAMLSQSPFELSGGQKRRAAIAGVLAMEPKLLVLDAGHVAMYDTTSAVFARADELLQLGLSVPEVTKVFLRLREWGLDVPADVYTVPYAANILRGMLEKGAGTC